MAATAQADAWLRRLPLALLSVLLALICLLLWRVASVVYRVEESVVAVSKDVQAVTAAAANISKHVDDLVERMTRLEEKTERAVGMDDLEAALDSLGNLRHEKLEGPVNLSPEGEKEIGCLLSQVRSSGLQFIESGKVRSSGYFYLHLYAKYRFYKSTIGSAEDFIAKVATESIAGHPYYVIGKDSKRVELGTWLKGALVKMREEGQALRP
jgi:cell division protein FtsB